MGENLRSAGEMSAMEAGNNGTEMIATTEEVTTSLSSSLTKRRKVDHSEAELVNLPPNDSVSTGSSFPVNSTTASFVTSLEELSDAEKDNMKSTDLKRMDSKTEISTFNIDLFCSETSPLSELCGEDSGEFMESSSTTKNKSSPTNSQQKPSVAETPSAAEIEEFFSKAEKQLQKRFAEKYNYDIVKDVPLEGQYEWIRLNHPKTNYW